MTLSLGNKRRDCSNFMMKYDERHLNKIIRSHLTVLADERRYLIKGFTSCRGKFENSFEKDSAKISKSTVQVIIMKNNFHPYKPKLFHKRQPRHLNLWLLFCSWFQFNGPLFARKILFSNKAMWCTVGNNNTYSVIGSPNQHSFKTKVCQILGPYCFFFFFLKKYYR